MQQNYKKHANDLNLADKQIETVMLQQDNLNMQMKDIKDRIHTIQLSVGNNDWTKQFVAIYNSIDSIRLQLQHTIHSIKTQKRNIKAIMSSLKKQIQDIKNNINKSMKEREDNKHRLDFIIVQMLKRECRIYTQSFHEGEMNGVCCRHLLGTHCR